MSVLASELHPDLRDLVGHTIAERYRIDSILGIGGMAVVFRAHHLGLKRDVAVKVLHPGFITNEEISARFEREAESASRLDHPNCVQVTDFGSTGVGMKYMVMQLLEGRELAELLTAPMDPLRCVEMVIQVARGLDHAHKQGVVHRDIKPENIFITTDHQDREVLKLVDFGISKIVGGSTGGHKTTAGLVFGTPAYMSPEQAAGMEADARADLYSLGVIMYQMLSGRLPFEADDPVQLVRMQVGRDPDPLPGTVPPVLAGVVQRLLMKDRDERFSSAAELIATLESIWPLIGGIPHALNWATSTGPIDLSTSGLLRADASGQIPLTTITGERELISGARQPTSLEIESDDDDDRRPRKKSKFFRRVAMLTIVAGGVYGADRLGYIDARDLMAKGRAEVARLAAGDDAATGAGAQDGSTDVVRVGVDALTLAQVDKLILAGKFDDADKLLGPLLDEFSEDPELLWRKGRILALRKRQEVQALVAYGQAIDKDPSLLENKDFYAELYELLGDRKIRKEALDLALQKMGTHGHKFLLNVVNDDKRPLDYHDRQRALTELRKDPVNLTLINDQLNMALDLLQASESLTPCRSYATALEAIAAHPDYFFHRRVEKATLPTVEEAEGKQEDASACDGLEARRGEVLEMLAALEPGQANDTTAQAAGGEHDPIPAAVSGGTTAKPAAKPDICATKRGRRLKKCRKK